MNETNKAYEVVNTKIATPIYRRLSVILRKKNMNFYRLFQNFCDCLIHNTDDRHNLTPETEKTMAVFENMIGWENNFNLSDPTAKPEVSEATYYMTAEGKNGVRVVHVERPFFGQWKQNFNVQQILERFLCLTFPSLYRRLRFIAVCRDCASIFELLTEIVTELEAEEVKKEYLEGFEDDDRVDYGMKPSNTRQRRRVNKTMDMFENEHRSEKDTEADRQWLEENMEGKPHGYEW